MQDQTAVIPLSNEWWDEQSRLFGTTRIQTQFAGVMIERSGIQLFEAARLAGAQGDYATQSKREFDAVIHPPNAN